MKSYNLTTDKNGCPVAFETEGGQFCCSTDVADALTECREVLGRHTFACHIELSSKISEILDSI